MRLKILLSYWYYKNADLDSLFSKHFSEPYPEVFADSGAYSAMTQGATITLDEYEQWIKRWQHHFVAYSNLDVIGSSNATLANQKGLEDRGLEPIPVFHTGEDWSALDHYLSRYAYVALGGMVPYMREARMKLMPWLVKCFRLAEGRAVYHGFGCTSWEVLKSFRWYSVDSSSWGQGFRYGTVPLFNTQKGGFVDVQLGDRENVYQYSRLIRSLGFDPEDFADRARNDRAKICALSALSYLKAEAWLKVRHGEVHIPGTTGLAGLRLNLVDANATHYMDADRGLKLHFVDARNTLGDLSSVSKHIEGMKDEKGSSDH